MKVLKKAYLEAHERAESYQQQLEAILPKKKSLEEALVEKEALCAKLNKEVLTLRDEAIAAQAKSANSPTKGGKTRPAAELEQLLEQAKKENEDLEEKMVMLRDSLSINEKMLTHMKDGFMEQIQMLNKKLEAATEKLETTEKERNDLKASCEQYEMRMKINREQKS